MESNNDYEQFKKTILELIRNVLPYSETPAKAIPKILEELQRLSEAKLVAIFRCPEGSINANHSKHNLIDIFPKRNRKLLDNDTFEKLTDLLQIKRKTTIISEHNYKETFKNLKKNNLGLSILLPIKSENIIIGGYLILGLPNKQKLSLIENGLEAIGDIFSLIFRFSELYVNMKGKVAERTSALKASEEKFRNFFEDDLSGDYLLNADGFILDCNKAFLDIFGYKSKNELLNKHISVLYDNESEFNKIKKTLLNNTILRNYESRRKCKDGRHIFVVENCVSSFNAKGEITEIKGYLYDITERKKAEESLKLAELRFESVLKNTPSVAVQAYKMNGTVIYWSSASENLYGYKKEEALGRNLLDLIIPEKQRNLVKKDMKCMAESGKPIPASELQLIHKNGSIVSVYSSHVVVNNLEGEAELFCLDIDLSSRKKAEDALRESEQEIKSIFRSAPIGIGVVINRSITKVNPRLCEITAYKAEELIGNDARMLYPTVDDYEFVGREKYKQIRKDGTGMVETKWKRKDGKIIDVLLSSTVIDKNMPELGHTFTALDISMRKNYESQLKSEKKWSEKLINYAPNIVVGLKDNSKIAVFNKYAEKLTGYKSEEVIGKEWIKIFIPKEKQHEISHVWRDIISNNQINHSFENEIITKFGKKRLIQWQNTIINENDKFNMILSLGLDITERRKAEKELKHIEWMLSADNSDDIEKPSPSYGDLTVFNKERTILDAVGPQMLHNIVNEYLNMLQTSAAVYERNGDYALGIFSSGWCKYLDKASRELCNTDDNKEALECGKWLCHESCWTNASVTAMVSGKTTDIECEGGIRIFAVPIIVEQKIIGAINFGYGNPPRDPEKLSLLASKYNVPVEKLVQLANEYKSRPPYIINMAKQRIVSSAKLIGEIVERKSYEKKLINQNDEYASLNEEYLSINEELEESNIQLLELNNKLEEALEKAEENDKLKTAFLANMSHEIRTPMNGIIGFLELIKTPNLNDDKRNSYIDIVNKSGKRLLNTINDIVEVSKIEAGDIQIEISKIDLKDFFNYYFEFFLPQAERKNISLKFVECKSNEKIIFTDKTKLHSILTNLIKNAIKFTEKGQIEIGCIYEDSSLFKFYVKDTGKGISKVKVNDIFERFVQEDISLTRGHEGSGLGLAITKAYVEALGGEIWVDSEPQKGSCFYFTIADFNEKDKDSFANKTKVMDNPPPNLFSKDTKILIVEDDKASMLFIEAVLNPYNCEILKCDNGLEAINICKSNADIDIIIMDIKIPIMDGYTATRKIRKFNKDVIIIAQTAYALLGEERKALDAGCNDYLAKPIQKNDLLNILHKYF